MVKEQAVLRLPGQTEIPLIAFDDWRFWVFLIIVVGVILFWIARKDVNRNGRN